MKPLFALAFSIMLISTSALGAPIAEAPVVDACHAVKVGVDRAVCYDKQRLKTDAERTAAAAEKTKDPLEQMRLEEEALSKRLQGICRGC
jgi:hypothetical protein